MRYYLHNRFPRWGGYAAHPSSGPKNDTRVIPKELVVSGYDRGIGDRSAEFRHLFFAGCDRDGWSEGIFAQNFAYDVLPLAEVDVSGKFKAVFVNTAQSIIHQRAPDAYYGADWSGAEWDLNHRWMTWAAHGLAPAAKVTASISGTTMTVSSISAGKVIVGQIVQGAGVSPGTQVTALGSRTGGFGTYTVSVSQTGPSETMTAGGRADDYCCNSLVKPTRS